MPGPISQSNPGSADRMPYVPSHNYPNGQPKICPCGHHEGYHDDRGECLHSKQFDKCGCPGLPDDCFTSDEEFNASAPPFVSGA